MSIIKQTYEYGSINTLMGHSDLIPIVDVVINIVTHTYIHEPFSPNLSLLNVDSVI